MKTLIRLATLLLISCSVVMAADFEKLYAESSDSVVTVYTKSISFENNQPRSKSGVGSGVLIEKDQILTAAHVVDGAQTIEILFTDGKRISADILSLVRSSDIALLKLRESHPNPTIATLADSDETGIGSDVFIIGAPFGISQTLSVGILSGRMNRGFMAAGAPIEFLQTDASINTGNSGGPMFNTRGEVIGIVSFILSKSGGFDGVGFATSSNSARDALLSSPGILAGFEGVMIDAHIAKALNLPKRGFLVQRVNSESAVGQAGLTAGYIPAEIAGHSMLLGGDLIMEIIGVVCEEPHDFELIKDSLTKLDGEETYSIKVYRKGEIVDLVVGPPMTAFLEHQ